MGSHHKITGLARNKPVHMWAINLQQGSQEYTMESQEFSTVSSINSVGKTGTEIGKRIKLDVYFIPCFCLITKSCPTLL